MRPPHAWRYLIIQILLAVLGIGILAQLVRIQTSAEAKAILVENEPYGGEWRTYYPARGEIYDRHGHLLAGNQTVYEVGVDMNAMSDPNSIALATSVYLGLDFNTVLNQISIPKPGVVYVTLADFIPADQADELIDLQKTVRNDPTGKSLDGLNFKAHLQRCYPEITLASNIMGFYSLDKRSGYLGRFGVEEKYDSLLAGLPVTLWVPTNPNQAGELPQIPPGATLILTIDREIQAATEQILDSALQTYGADSGTIIVSNPKTGEILAMAATPHLDPNKYWTYEDIFPSETPYNRAISQAYEPGSVLKILTMAAALDAGVVQPGTTHLDTGIFNYGGAEITNWEDTVWSMQDMTGCLQHSINTCLAWVATQMGNEKFYNYMQRFGLGHPTGIDLAGEAAGRLKLPGDGDWYPVDLATNAFGQGVAVTPIQMVMAASSIANGGQMIYPHVLYAVVQNGQQRNNPPHIVGNPITTTTAQTLNEMLAVSLENEASLALVPGYRISGKTGTAEIPTPYGYTSYVTNTSFVGWGPVDDPQFLVYVWIEKPSTSIWGSEVTAPVFRQVVEKLVILMGIPPDQVRLQSEGQ